MTGDFHFRAIGFVQSPFKDKYGIPRQSGLVAAAKGVVKLLDEPDLKTALRSMDEFSHLWIVFVFHEHGGKKWKPSIRPPRLGGQIKVGVLASRSPHRPNPIGLSAVAIDRIDIDAAGGPEIHVSGLDLLDGTPVLDLKPYITYADSIPDADSGWASTPIERVIVRFADAVSITDSSIKNLITQVLALDPRPAFQKRQFPVTAPSSAGLEFGLEISGFDVKYKILDGAFHVTAVSAAR